MIGRIIAELGPWSWWVLGMLLLAAAERLSVPIAELSTEPGRVMHPASGRSLAYGEIAEAAAGLPVPETVTLRESKDFRWIGKPVERLDIRAKSTGKAQYAIDTKVEGLAPYRFSVVIENVREESLITEKLIDALRCRKPLPPPDMVIEEQPEPEQPARAQAGAVGQDEAQRPDDVRRDAPQHLPLGQGLAHQGWRQAALGAQVRKQQVHQFLVSKLVRLARGGPQPVAEI